MKMLTIITGTFLIKNKIISKKENKENIKNPNESTI